MFGYLEGFSENEEILYCSHCASPISIRYNDGTVLCEKCGLHFGMIEIAVASLVESIMSDEEGDVFE